MTFDTKFLETQMSTDFSSAIGLVVEESAPEPITESFFSKIKKKHDEAHGKRSDFTKHYRSDKASKHTDDGNYINLTDKNSTLEQKAREQLVKDAYKDIVPKLQKVIDKYPSLKGMFSAENNPDSNDYDTFIFDQDDCIFVGYYNIWNFHQVVDGKVNARDPGLWTKEMARDFGALIKEGKEVISNSGFGKGDFDSDWDDGFFVLYPSEDKIKEYIKKFNRAYKEYAIRPNMFDVIAMNESANDLEYDALIRYINEFNILDEFTKNEVLTETVNIKSLYHRAIKAIQMIIRKIKNYINIAINKLMRFINNSNRKKKINKIKENSREIQAVIEEEPDELESILSTRVKYYKTTPADRRNAINFIKDIINFLGTSECNKIINDRAEDIIKNGTTSANSILNFSASSKLYEDLCDAILPKGENRIALYASYLYLGNNYIDTEFRNINALEYAAQLLDNSDFTKDFYDIQNMINNLIDIKDKGFSKYAATDIIEITPAIAKDMAEFNATYFIIDIAKEAYRGISEAAAKECKDLDTIDELINKSLDYTNKKSGGDSTLEESVENISESYIMNEALIKDKDDIYYNKDKWEDGSVNLCFILGLSGSGKSSMGSAMSKGSASIEHYDMDDIIFNKGPHSMDFYKDMGDLAYKFFNGPGQKYYIERKDIKRLFKDERDYRRKISNAFVDFAITYAGSHKNIKFIIEGVWLYRFISPEKLKRFAVCIKGTSAKTSITRAIDRDNDKSKVLKSGVWIRDDNYLKKFRRMYGKNNDEPTLKECGYIRPNIDDNEINMLSAYESYLESTINNEMILNQALTNLGVMNEATVSVDIHLQTEIKGKWERFLNFINRIMDRFQVSMEKILFNNKGYLEKYQDIILNSKWRDDMQYEYLGDYNEGLDRCRNTPVPPFNYERDAEYLRQEGYEGILKSFMAGKNFKYTADQDLAKQFKSYFLAEERGKSTGSFSNLNPKVIYDFCYNYSKILDIVKKDQSNLKQSTSEFMNAVNKELRARGEKTVKTSASVNYNSNTGAQYKSNNQTQPTASGTQNNSGNNNQNGSQQESFWINLSEADGDQNNNGTNNTTNNNQNNNNGQNNNQQNGVQITSTIPNKQGEDGDSQEQKPSPNNTTVADLNNIVNKWITLCRCLTTGKFTALQQIARDYMAIIKAHVQAHGGKGTKAEDNANKDNNENGGGNTENNNEQQPQNQNNNNNNT